jgi:hypothetical protein
MPKPATIRVEDTGTSLLRVHSVGDIAAIPLLGALRQHVCGFEFSVAIAEWPGRSREAIAARDVEAPADARGAARPSRHSQLTLLYPAPTDTVVRPDDHS